MPGILKGELKDVLILKHIESELFNAFPGSFKNKVTEKYDIATYFGYYSRRKQMYSFENAWITLPNTVGRVAEQGRLVEFGGINFLPNVDYKPNKKRDKSSVICVTNNTIRKNLHALLKALVKVKRRLSVRLLIQETGSGFIAAKYNVYLKELITVVKNKHDLEVHWINKDNLIPRDRIFEMISSSEVLVLPSFIEGAARVVGEAHMCGTNVVLKANMKGSTNFSLMPQDYEFNNINNLASILDDFLYEEYNLEQIKSIKSAYLASENRCEFFRQLGVALDCDGAVLAAYNEEVDMVNFLSCHQSNLPRGVTDNSNTDEITTLDTMFIFVEWLLGKQSSLDLGRAKRRYKLKKLGLIKHKLQNLRMLIS